MTPLILAAIVGVVMGSNLFGHGRVLSWVIEGPPPPVPTAPPVPTPTPTPSPSPTPPPKPKPTATPAPTRIPVPQYTPEQISGFFNQYAGQYGIDPHIL